MEILNHISLKSYSTFAVGGVVKYFIILKKKEDIVEAFYFIKSKIKEKEIDDFYILSGGSNTIFSDDLQNLCVLKVDIVDDFEILKDKEGSSKETLVKSSAGNSWDSLVSFCCEENLYGLENLSYIPGSVGAAPVQNIGAYGVEVSSLIDSIEVYDIENNLFKNIKNENNIFAFGYRDSIFKKLKNKYLIVSVTFKLKAERDVTAKYHGLDIEDDDAKSIRGKVINIRKSKLPDWGDVPNCGSFFKNPIVSKTELENVLSINKDMKHFTNGDEPKLSAASLIDSLNLKGHVVGGASVSANHALILINKDRSATYEDVKNLSEYIAKEVFDKYGVSLEREVNMI